MKFTVLGHACLYVEHNGVSVLFDPWLVGSCYWRSWWNFPEPDIAFVEKIKPDYIYITHLHWDHFHGPTLRRFSRHTQVLLPLAPEDRMVRDMKAIGFRNISEIPHGAPFKLANNFTLFSYQFRPAFTDSAAVLSDGNTVLLNANDCKLFGLPLKQITSKFKRFDFVFRSHSNASQIPYCVEGYKHQPDQVRSKNEYIEEFARFAAYVNTRYAVPFASNHCYSHKETLQFNELAVSPREVSEYFTSFAQQHGLRAQCTVMPSGSSWDAESGFSIRPFDYENKEGYISTLLARHKDALEQQYAKEDAVTASFESFKRYFKRFFTVVPKLVSRLFPKRVVFKVREHDRYKYWLLDLMSRKVQEVERDEACDMQIEVHALVLNDCVRKRMFSTWGPSKRLRIRLYGESTHETAATFFGILDAYETDVFPLLTKRHVKVAARRWREPVEFLRLVAKHKLLRKPFVVKELYPLPEQTG